jgi:hypothetical protein
MGRLGHLEHRRHVDISIPHGAQAGPLSGLSPSQPSSSPLPLQPRSAISAPVHQCISIILTLCLVLVPLGLADLLQVGGLDWLARLALGGRAGLLAG